VIRRGGLVLRLKDINLPAVTKAVTYFDKDGQAASAIATLTDDRIIVPRFASVKLGATEMTVSEPNDFGAADSYLTWNEKTALRPSQVPGVEAVFTALTQLGGCTMHGQTGSGKTVMALNVMHRLQPRRTLILVDQLDIAAQWASRIQTYLPGTPIKFLMQESRAVALLKTLDPLPEIVKPGRIVIATAQTLHRSKTFTANDPLDCDLLICDEAHVFSAPTFLNAIFRVNFRYSLALTATPDRKDGLQQMFLDTLGSTIIPVEGEVMLPTIVPVEAPDGGIVEGDYRMFFCKVKRGMTWIRACVECPHMPLFPNCKAEPRVDKVSMEKAKLSRVSLIVEWHATPEFLDWAMTLLRFVYQKRRRVFVFAEDRAVLERLARDLAAEIGEDRVGIFLGRGGKLAVKQTSKERDAALDRQFTFVTFGIANKAIDVVNKDCAIFLSPPADPRQSVGRIRRVDDGKVDPIAFVAVPPIPTIKRTFWRMCRWAKKLGWPIKPMTRLPSGSNSNSTTSRTPTSR
jgi:hypothetical protein